jgi:hypothetical protein
MEVVSEVLMALLENLMEIVVADIRSLGWV